MSASADRNQKVLDALAPALWHGLEQSHFMRSATARVCCVVAEKLPLFPARMLVRLATRCEGGVVNSRSFRRELLARDGVILGAWSHGPSLALGALPANTIIGRYSSIGPNIVVANENHPMSGLTTSGIFYDPGCRVVSERALPDRPLLALGHDVWIGGNVCILPGCHRIGHGAVIGAGAVVTHDVPAFAVVVGNPAKVLRMRMPPELAARWIASRWWRLSPRELVDAGATNGGVEAALGALEPRCQQWSQSLEHADHEFDLLVASADDPHA